jgi:hypothetical protein
MTPGRSLHCSLAIRDQVNCKVCIHMNVTRVHGRTSILPPGIQFVMTLTNIEH